MSDRRTRNPYSGPVSAIDADAINSASEAIRCGTGTKNPSTAAGEQVRRKAIGSQSSRPMILTDPNTLKGEFEAPTSVNSGHTAFYTPSTLPRVGARNTVPGSRPQPNSISSVHQIERVSNLNNWNDRQAPQDIFTSYDHGEDIGNGNMHNLYASSSSTINSTPPTIPSLLSPSPLAPSPLFIFKQQPTQMSTIREIAIVGTVCLAHFLTQAGLSQSIAPLPLITSSFTTPTHAPSPSWYSAAYSLTVGTFILPSGRLGDIYGPKRLFLIGWLWFAVASLAAGLYPRVRATGDQQGNGDGGENFFCFCRALQGIGPALLMPNGLAILGRIYEEGNRKNMAFALFGASAPVGFVVGSVMSSLLAQKTNWCWAYWGLAIACATMAMISVPIIPHLPGTVASGATKNAFDTPENGGTRKAPLWKQLDTPGTILGVSGLILINVAVNQAALVNWSTPYTYFLLILGITILLVFFFIEFTPSLTSHPLIPLGILSLDTCFVLACIACGWATFSIWIFYIWEFLERLRTLSPLLAAAQFSPAAISGLLAAVSTGFLLSKTTPQVIMLLSMCAFFIGTTLIATTPVNQIYWAQAFFSIIIMPWGMDMSFPSATILLSSKVGPENQGVAMSLVNTVVNYSISVGLGLAGTVQSLVDKDGTQPLKGFRGAWYFGMGLSGTGVVIAVTFLALGAWEAKKGGSRREKEGVGDA